MSNGTRNDELTSIDWNDGVANSGIREHELAAGRTPMTADEHEEAAGSFKRAMARMDAEFAEELI